MGEYESAFTSLSRFGTKFVEDEEEKCRLFLDGLNLSIRSKVGLQNYSSYNELVQGALKAEGYERQYFNRRQERGRRGVPQMFRGSPGQPLNRGTLQMRQTSLGYRSSGSSSRGSSSRSGSGSSSKSSPYARPPSVTGSKTEGARGNVDRSYDLGRGLPHCNICGRAHSG